MECKYHDLYTPLYEKRAQITKGKYFGVVYLAHDQKIDFTEMKINIHLTEIQYLIGAYEPTDAECDWPSDDDDELAEEIKDKVRYAYFHQANCNHV